MFNLYLKENSASLLKFPFQEKYNKVVFVRQIACLGRVSQENVVVFSQHNVICIYLVILGA